MEEEKFEGRGGKDTSRQMSVTINLCLNFMEIYDTKIVLIKCSLCVYKKKKVLSAKSTQ